ncbi:MAG: preprotein translocase subunit SecG, partial [Clostridia bacterium]|nr:preprotein translocase subunit SecG [Clostridia bacterium]
MSALTIILDIFLILLSLVLIVAVLMQQGQRQGLGAIAGGADTFFGKGKAKGIDAKLAKITKIAAVVFIVLAIVTTIVVSHNTPDAVSPEQLINEAINTADEATATDEAAAADDAAA